VTEAGPRRASPADSRGALGRASGRREAGSPAVGGVGAELRLATPRAAELAPPPPPPAHGYLRGTHERLGRVSPAAT
jgi:hypothetical protein